ncbi:DUF6296 family protein [Kitasatospora sp. NPDC001159]
MNIPSRYAITLPGVPGPPEVVIVHATGEATRVDQPVFLDAAATFRVEIVAGIARPAPPPQTPGTRHLAHGTSERGTELRPIGKSVWGECPLR